MVNFSLKQGIAAIFYMVFIGVYAQERTTPASQNEELGKVSWYRDYQVALKQAKEQNKAVLILFQEVPGCSTCRNYGNNVLSHPLMVEAIENMFIPLTVFNNKGGKDKQVLQRYGEPSWNNPVVRIVNEYGVDIVSRVSGDYSSVGLYQAMEKALKAEKKSIPEFMELLGVELTSSRQGSVKEKYFQMYCFWSGEKHFGIKEGIVATEPGFLGGHEVVKVKYDQKLVSENQLISYAKGANYIPVAKDNSYRTATRDEKYYLQHTNYKYLPLTELQKARVNSALGNRQSAEKYLSPKQLTWLNTADSKKEILYDKDFALAWEKIANR